MNYVTERVTDSVAVGALVSPVWLPYIQNVSDLSALLLPVAGLVWLVIQIIGYTKGKR